MLFTVRPNRGSTRVSPAAPSDPEHDAADQLAPRRLRVDHPAAVERADEPADPDRAQVRIDPHLGELRAERVTRILARRFQRFRVA